MDERLSFCESLMECQDVSSSGMGSALAVTGKQVQITAKAPARRLIKEEPTDETHSVHGSEDIRRGKGEKSASFPRVPSVPLT